MNALVKVFHILAIIPLLMSGCAMSPAQMEEEERAASKIAVYESILGLLAFIPAEAEESQSNVFLLDK